MGPNMPTFNLPFFLTKEKLTFLTDRFPRTTFRCVDDRNHDHPLAHTETMIAVQKAYRLVPAGSTVVDYFGSVKAMADFTRSQRKSKNPKRGFAYIDYLSPKAYIRHANVGEEEIDGVPQYAVYTEGPELDLGIKKTGLFMEGLTILGSTLTWFCKHTLYYMSDEQIQTCLNVQGSKIVAIVHRHANDKGELFNGECTYAKKDGKMVQQTNKLTGENYVHSDLSWLWDSNTKVKYTNSGAFTWTFHMISTETWIIELVALPTSIDERFGAISKQKGTREAAEELNEHSLAPTPFEHPVQANLPKSRCELMGGVPIIKFEHADLPDCKLTNEALYKFLYLSMVGQPRNADRWNDLCALGRTQLQQSSDFPGKKNYACEPEDLMCHVTLAFVTGLKKENQLLRAVQAFKHDAKQHIALTDGVSVIGGTSPAGYVSSVALMAKRVNAGWKRGNLVDGVLDVANV